MESVKDSFKFEAETQQLLKIVINSLYSEKEIFLRELVSNSSDALDRFRIETLKDTSLSDDEELAIWIDRDNENNILKIRDNGIGMNREDLIGNIGTIARSGTREILEKVKQSEANSELAELIGQFGVGFYSAFIVSDEVEILTRKFDSDTAYLWKSAGDGNFTVEEAQKEKRGTEITLKLKAVDEEDAIENYIEEFKIKSLIKKYSDFVKYPIKTLVEREEIERDAEGKEVEGAEKKKVITEETLNSMKPIWTRNASEVKDEELNEFYRSISHDWQEPLTHINLKAEGTFLFYSLLFIPSQAPFDLYTQNYKPGLSLFVKNILIMDKCDQILPDYLRFIKGIVECSDLPLNVSRELLQENKQITQVRKKIIKKVMDTLSYMQSEEKENYLKFWKAFGRVLKEGISNDFENRDKISKLLLFESTADPEKLTSLEDYVSRMKEDQEEIYYLTGESRINLESSPHLEVFKEKDIEVLFMTDPVDEIMTGYLNEFESKKLKSIGKGTVEFGTEEEKKKQNEELDEKKKEFSSLFEIIEKHLESDIKEVRLSNRLKSSPVCIVVDEFQNSPNLDKLLKQVGGENPMAAGQKQKYILEVNGEHPIIEKMKSLYSENSEDDRIKDYAEILLGQAYLAEGLNLPNTNRFTNLVSSLMA